MKRLLSLLLALALLLGLCGCGAGSSQMAVPTENVGEATEPLFWPPLPEETEQTEQTTLPADTKDTASAQQPSTGSKPVTKPTVDSGDTDATYIPREDEDDGGVRQEEEAPVASDPDQSQQEEDPAPEDTRTEQTDPPVQTDSPEQTEPEEEEKLDPDGHYNSVSDVALYIHQYGKLPGNFYTKSQAEALFGWKSGPLSKLAAGMSIGGDRFYNKEGLLPAGTYYECDIGTVGASSRGAKRIVFKKDGTVYYTQNHYKSFSKLYGPR